MKRVSKIEWIMDKNIKDVWNTVTNLKDYKWRSDLSKIEIINDNEFIEYFTNGGQTNFLITSKNPYNSYSFDMKNNYFVGQWTGDFIEINSQKTKQYFLKKLILKTLSFGSFLFL